MKMKKVVSFALAALMLLNLCACTQENSNSLWQEQYEIAMRYLSDGNYEEAIIAFTSAIEIDPKQASAYIGRADTYVEKGSIEDLLLAIEDYDTAIALEPTQWESYQKKNAVLTTMGDYADGLATLYKYKEASPSQEADEAIQSYLERLSFDIEIEEPTQQPKATFADTGVIEAGATGEKVVYLVLTDVQTGVKQVAASLAIKFDTDLGFDETSIEIVKNHEDVWLFYLWTGVGMTSTFLYTIHTNQILVLEPGLTNWNFTDDYLIGETITFAAGDKEEAYFYDWSGYLLYKLEDIVGSCILDGNSLYYADCVKEGKKQVYHVWTMALGEYVASTVCTVELHNGYLYLGDGKINWDDIQAQTSNSMDIHSAHDVLLSENENEIDQLLTEVLEYMQENYPNEGIIDVEYYAEHDGMISTRIVSSASIFVGAEIEKATRTVYLYNFGRRNIGTFVLPG